MKYIVVLGDGMADYPVPELGDKTPLEAAHKPNMDFLAQNGQVGMVKTVPDGMAPGSDTANLSVMGYDPAVYYSGRSPLEAVSMGIDLKPDDVAFRCNLVTVTNTERFEDAVMLDHSSDEISTEEARELIQFLSEELVLGDGVLYPGISYRHCLVLPQAQTGSICTPPHDILEKQVADYLPSGRYGEQLLALMEHSFELLKEHPVNKARIAKGLNPANACWFWGEGTRPALTLFEKQYGVKGGVVSAVDLIKGIGICAGLEIVEVEGATGNIHTNFTGKADAALNLLKNGCDYVYIHIEAPDECGHRHEIENKVKSIELIDRDMLGRLMEALQKDGEAFSILVMPDHPTPLALRTHTSEPVPFVLYRSNETLTPNAACYSEAFASATDCYIEAGHLMTRKLLGMKA